MRVLAAAALYAATVITVAAQSPARTVWDGAFTAAQAERGQLQYAMSCARCHGGSLEGGMGRALVGDGFWNKWREQTVADLLDYVSKNMPMGETSVTRLSAPAYADIVSYVLRSNDLPAGSVELTPASSADVHIVAKGGSTGELPATTLARVVGCLAPQAPDRTWHITAANRPERVKSIDDKTPAAGPGGDRQYSLKFVLQPLTPLVGQRVAVVGILIGDGGADGINVNTVTALGSCN